MKHTKRYTIAAFAFSAFLFAMTGCDADKRSDDHHMDGDDHHGTMHDAAMPDHQVKSDEHHMDGNDQHSATPDSH